MHGGETVLIIVQEESIGDIYCDIPFNRKYQKQNDSFLCHFQIIVIKICSSKVSPLFNLRFLLKQTSPKFLLLFDLCYYCVYLKAIDKHSIIIKLMQKGDQSGQEEYMQKRRRSQSKYNKDLPRYECFCAKQYLSYPALYLHMKNKHSDYFQSNKSSGKVQPTKLVESYNAQEGYKVYKIAIDSSQKQQLLNKLYDHNFQDNKQYFMNPNNSNFMYPNMSYSNPNYGFMMNGPQFNEADRKPLQRQAVIQVALSMYMMTLRQKPFKQRYEAQLFFIMLADCINKNYELLKDERIESKEVKRYTAEYDSEKIMNILPFFQQSYLPSAADPSKPTSFFVKKSNIISSKEYKNVLKQFHAYVYDKETRPTHFFSPRMLPEPQLPSSDNQGQSEEASKNEDPEEEDDDQEENEEENGIQS